jgi:GNAT superfamily N-acetyltransferase
MEPLASITVRLARADDAPAIVRITRASIAELCFADHRGDPDVLAAWLANKTVPNVEGWLVNPQLRNVVAEFEGDPVAAGAMTLDGHILLNYVAPSARFRGASDAMLAFMEQHAHEAGVAVCTLESTMTAHRFYLRRGYVDTGGASEKFGAPNFPMHKALSPTPSPQTRP